MTKKEFEKKIRELYQKRLFSIVGLDDSKVKIFVDYLKLNGFPHDDHIIGPKDIREVRVDYDMLIIELTNGKKIVSSIYEAFASIFGNDCAPAYESLETALLFFLKFK